MEFIDVALEEAKKALYIDEVPIGAIIVKDGKIIGRGHNLRETIKNPLAHAEIIAINEASKTLGNWRLNGCSMFVTLEPCIMCAGAIVQSRLSELNIGTFDPNLGACGSVLNLVNNQYINSNIKVNWLYNNECSEILKEFFKSLRNKSI
ncbi:cytosine deaminase [Clostridium putrefaciens]|uniref:tRNA-specific adenosine deaminase n=1 Tax=Clostridium putrefaciens TaxID=99675 RepID=A0A381J3J0_9CLOT|nr:nucleoside deaminase [Clostridium putrefaciens]SUY44892.1 cytosine deaminase [Clostridium putrefaciens]